MNKFLILFALLFTISCSKDESSKKTEMRGDYMDTQGLSVLSIWQDSTTKAWTVGNPDGKLIGKKANNLISGTTDLGDTFSMKVNGDSAVYTLMGIPTTFVRISHEKAQQFFAARKAEKEKATPVSDSSKSIQNP